LLIHEGTEIGNQMWEELDKFFKASPMEFPSLQEAHRLRNAKLFKEVIDTALSSLEQDIENDN
jgi:hypothetical protein